MIKFDRLKLSTLLCGAIVQLTTSHALAIESQAKTPAPHQAASNHDDHSDHQKTNSSKGLKAVASRSKASANSIKNIEDLKYHSYNQPMKIFPFEVQTTSGQNLNQETLKGRWSLITFGFTACGDVCPMTMARLKRELNKLPDGAKDKVSVYFASLDPDTDKPKVLDDYIKAWKIKFPIAGLVGSKEVMRKFARQFSPVQEKKISTLVPKSKPEIIHTGILFLINPSGEMEGFFDDTGKGEKIASSVAKLMSAGGLR